MAYTRSCMQAIVPHLGSMPTIGSVAVNFARNDDSEATEHLYGTIESRHIQAMFGSQDFDDYMEHAMAERIAETKRQEKKRASRSTSTSKRCSGSDDDWEY
ncbi:MAG: hypothetical protein M1827_004309 [Pycnora praestabilis]|nr:MAG: hypothetical protein M1827_004309 [Pycnora praestabilis]